MASLAMLYFTASVHCCFKREMLEMILQNTWKDGKTEVIDNNKRGSLAAE